MTTVRFIMKRSISFLTIAVGVVLVAACSSGTTATPTSTVTPTGTASGSASPSGSAAFDLSKYTFAFDSPNTGNFYHITFQCGVVAAAKGPWASP